LTALIACLAVTARAQGDAPTSQNAHALAPVGPLGHWRCDDGATPAAAADASGNGFHGVYSKGASTSAECPTTKFTNSGCLTLDGATGIVSIPDSPALRITGDITIAFWRRKTANINDWVRMVGKGNGAQRNFGIWSFPGEDHRIKFQMYNANGGSVLEVDSPGSPATALNVWCHITCSVSVNVAAMHINGIPVATGTRSDVPGTSADPVTFGHAGFHSFFGGQLDDIRIYNRALSTSEIVYLAAGHGPPAAPSALEKSGADAQQVSLKWAATTTAPPAGTATYYLVKRSATSGTGYATVSSNLTSTTYTEARPDAGKAWHYVVTAVNTAGESAASNELVVPADRK
jgi:hypothetical protein